MDLSIILSRLNEIDRQITSSFWPLDEVHQEIIELIIDLEEAVAEEQGS